MRIEVGLFVDKDMDTVSPTNAAILKEIDPQRMESLAVWYEGNLVTDRTLYTLTRLLLHTMGIRSVKATRISQDREPVD